MVREPITALTDFGLAAITAIWAVLVFRASEQRASRLFALALAATALSTLIGGLYHMFPGPAVWKLTAFSVGLVSFLLGLSVAVAFLSPRITRLIAQILLVQLCVYAIAVLISDAFWLLIADYGSVMAAVLIVCLMHWSNAAARWITAAILISFAASALQMSPIRVGPLNHNDIYHVVDVVALYCFYRGGMVLSTARSSSQPT
jgi:uncharacterized protein DUF6962